MTDYLTNDTELTSIANAIRAKRGTTGRLTFPTGFTYGIEQIDSSWGKWGQNETLIATQDLHYTEADISDWASKLASASTTASLITLAMPAYTNSDITVDLKNYDLVGVQNVSIIPRYPESYDYRGVKAAWLGWHMSRAMVDYVKEQDMLHGSTNPTKWQYYPVSNYNGTFATIETVYNNATTYQRRYYQTNSTASYGIYGQAPTSNFSSLASVGNGVYSLGYTWAGVATSSLTVRSHSTYCTTACLQKLANGGVDIYANLEVYKVARGTSFATKTNNNMEYIISKYQSI